MNDILLEKVLVLNQSYSPLSICNVKKAITLIYSGKAEVVASYPDRFIRSISLSYPLPSIVRLGIYINKSYQKIILTRKNIIKRDNHQCQYCRAKTGMLTIDHIIPKAKGGKDSWENLVTACVRCNNKKGDRSLEDTKMHLIKKPSRPSYILFMQQSTSHPTEDWKPFLFMN